MESYFALNTPWPDMLLRLGVATILGLLLGLERELVRVPAGLRTHGLVALGAAGFVLVALEMSAMVPDVQGNASDPGRIIEGVIVGVGFIGAGTIIQRGREVQGLTTGASVWLAGAIGAACGVGSIVLAAMLAVLGLILLGGLRLVEPLGSSKKNGET